MFIRLIKSKRRGVSQEVFTWLATVSENKYLLCLITNRYKWRSRIICELTKCAHKIHHFDQAHLVRGRIHAHEFVILNYRFMAKESLIILRPRVSVNS